VLTPADERRCQRHIFQLGRRQSPVPLVAEQAASASFGVGRRYTCTSTSREDGGEEYCRRSLEKSGVRRCTEEDHGAKHDGVNEKIAQSCSTLWPVALNRLVSRRGFQKTPRPQRRSDCSIGLHAAPDCNCFTLRRYRGQRREENTTDRSIQLLQSAAPKATSLRAMGTPSSVARWLPREGTTAAGGYMEA